MDTVLSNSPVAMPQGEQPVVHPFFRKDFGTPSRPPPSLENATVPPAGPNTLPPNVSSPLFSSSDPTNTAQMSLPYALQPSGTHATTLLSQDEDLNASRSKRRKIERTKQPEQEQPLQAGLSGWLGLEMPGSVAPQMPSMGVEPGIISIEPTPAPAELESAKKSFDTESASKDNTAIPDGSARPRKIVKLNTNGRLLSSPPRSPPDTTAPKRTGGKRGRPRKMEGRLVIIRYTTGAEGSIGKILDDILSGRMKHNPRPLPPTVPLRRPVQPQVNGNKPTHPFFLKKAPQKPPGEDTQDPQLSTHSPDHKGSSNQAQTSTMEAREQRPLRALSSVFGRRTNKFPELVHPLWPPQDLVHVRAFDPSQITQTLLANLENDHKKSKSPAITVPDEENALLASTAWARKAASLSLHLPNENKPTLRLPGRHAASGRILQTAINSQMSWSLPAQHSSCRSPLPVIKKLHSSLLSSVSAFDCGKYESRLWAQKYSPTMAADVLQVGQEAHVLRDWLRHLKITAVDTGRPCKESAKSKATCDKKRKKRKANNELEGFIVSSEEEASEMDAISGSDDELAGNVTVSAQKTVVRSGDLAVHSQHGGEKGRLANSIVLSGPPGCGKTASVYAVAKELDFEVFEINAGSRRSARDMLERVGDMTQNHLVHLLNETDDSSSRSRDNTTTEDTKQNKLMTFFKGQPSKNTKPSNATTSKSRPSPESEGKRTREQKQSLILLEEADLLFDEDRQFWTGVMTLISQSRRPIIITCNDESLIPIQDMSLHAILRYQRPPHDLALDYLLLVAANEGHVLKRDAVSKLYNASGMDIRRSLMDLNFWCQMAVGSEKGGLDWILPIWPPGANVDQNGERVRVLSLNTYEPYMGWFNRDTFLGDDSLAKETQALENTFHWWRLGIQDAEDAVGASTMELLPPDQYQSMSKLDQLDLLGREADYLDMRSSLDILCSECPIDTFKDVLDISSPPIPDCHRSNYVDAYPLLQADLRPEYSLLSESVCTTFDSLLSRVFRPGAEDIESASADRIFSGWAKSAARRSVLPSTVNGFRKVFEPIMRVNHTMPVATGRLAPSFENGLAPITEDIAPYVRAIMVFDGRLKVYRDNLFAAWAQEQGVGEKRMRTTRASRAALEGGDKTSTRKDRWFSDDINYYWVQSTGRPEWQHILFQMGHFHVQPVLEANGGNSDQASSN
ncbi:uncharacterized protein N7482_006544 [Penicillium canariense]|uniref:AAA+ ATPase domain-containing protein n=1 Tax=Penicillium canariense TaxID=189055 RepID=A0A9W9HXI8_9EURO|nr:uncharacterized protein N7482_006544 [Penicillium canariense]KAJ5159540.1 hypothetical protein N7482_006544 [Penicillium canariense]